MIGNKIGEGNKPGAQKLITSVITFGVVFSAVATIFLYTFKSWIFPLYTSNELVLENMNKIL